MTLSNSEKAYEFLKYLENHWSKNFPNKYKNISSHNFVIINNTTFAGPNLKCINCDYQCCIYNMQTDRKTGEYYFDLKLINSNMYSCEENIIKNIIK